MAWGSRGDEGFEDDEKDGKTDENGFVDGFLLACVAKATYFCSLTLSPTWGLPSFILSRSCRAVLKALSPNFSGDDRRLPTGPPEEDEKSVESRRTLGKSRRRRRKVWQS